MIRALVIYLLPTNTVFATPLAQIDLRNLDT